MNSSELLELGREGSGKNSLRKEVVKAFWKRVQNAMEEKAEAKNEAGPSGKTEEERRHKQSPVSG